jgi:hypothetical protein
MELVNDYVEFLGHVFYSSAVYRVREPIPDHALPTRLLERLSAGEALVLIDHAPTESASPSRAT